MSRIVHKGYLYEALNEKELLHIHSRMQHAIEDLNAVMNTVHDGNQKKAISSLITKTIDTFNEKIKGVDYHPDSLEDQEQKSREIDAKLDDQSNMDQSNTVEDRSNVTP